MSESDEALVKLNKILSHITSIDGQMSVLVKANGEKLLPLYKKMFKKKKNAMKVYLSLDGKLSGAEIASEVNIHPPDVTNSLNTLEQAGLIELKRVEGSKKIYSTNRASKSLGIETLFTKMLNEKNN